MNNALIIETKKLSIKFGSFSANTDIDLKLYGGEIHAIVGENGAGKSTLMKMLYGVYRPTSGEIYICGKKADLAKSRGSENGIGMVFQDFRLIPAFTAAENIEMSLMSGKKKIDRKSIKQRITELSEKYRISVDPDRFVWEMDLGERQRVEIIKVLMGGENMKAMIFDEPTSVLTYHEAEAFIEMLKNLKKAGMAVVLITHKLNEVMACADKITILRQGRITYSASREEGFDQKSMIAHMMGQEKYSEEPLNKKKADASGKEIFACKGLDIGDEHGRKILSNINMAVSRGEIVGIAGISGRGQREFTETIYGIRKPLSGTLTMDGEDISKADIRQRMEKGIVLISEDPKRDSIVAGMNIWDHFSLTGLKRQRDLGVPQEYRKVLRDFKVPDISRELITLSGGNIQRVMLARAMLKRPRLLLAEYPSRGLDVGTVETVHRALMDLKNDGSGILLVSEDLDELMKVSDRIVIISGNSITEKYDPEEMDAVKIGEIMIGGKKNG
jgi:ABC-type uncharacterized transport system ATPase subunit